MCSQYVSFVFPQEVWNSTKLNVMEKLFLSKIYQLSKKTECYANNSYFAKLFHLKNTRVSQIINSLIKNEYILAKYERKNLKVVRRVLTLNCNNPFTKLYEVLTQKCKENIEAKNTAF